jgi:hypothetical protein
MPFVRLRRPTGGRYDYYGISPDKSAFKGWFALTFCLSNIGGLVSAVTKSARKTRRKRG